MTKELICEYIFEDTNLRIVLEKEEDNNYVISTYDCFGNYIENMSRNIVKFKKQPTVEEFKKIWVFDIQTGVF